MVMTPGAAHIAALDDADPVAPLRAQFDLPDDVIYLDGNSLGPLPRATAGRIAAAITHEWGEGLIRSWNEAGWIDLPSRVGDKIARLIGARPGDVKATDSTSVNLFKVLAAALRLQRRDAPERHLIVSERGNFPTDLYIAEGLAQLLSDAHTTYRLALIDDACGLEAALAEKPAVLMLTQVDYRSGRLHDMAEVTAMAHRHGTLVVWDLAHSAGALPLEVEACGADFAVGCGYKYLNGGPGAPAFVWVAPRHQATAEQPLAGWFGHAAPFLFEPGYRAAEGATRFLAGTPAVLAMLALECGVDTVLAAEPYGGMAALRRKALALSQLFIEAVEAGPAGGVLRLASPREPTARASQVSFAAHAELGDGYALMQALIAEGVIGDFRAPNILRFGFAPLYLRYADVLRAAEIINSCVANARWRDARFHTRAAVT